MAVHLLPLGVCVLLAGIVFVIACVGGWYFLRANRSVWWYGDRRTEVKGIWVILAPITLLASLAVVPALWGHGTSTQVSRSSLAPLVVMQERGKPRMPALVVSHECSERQGDPWRALAGLGLLLMPMLLAEAWIERGVRVSRALYCVVVAAMIYQAWVTPNLSGARYAFSVMSPRDELGLGAAAAGESILAGLHQESFLRAADGFEATVRWNWFEKEWVERPAQWNDARIRDALSVSQDGGSLVFEFGAFAPDERQWLELFVDQALVPAWLALWIRGQPSLEGHQATQAYYLRTLERTADSDLRACLEAWAPPGCAELSERLKARGGRRAR